MAWCAREQVSYPGLEALRRVGQLGTRYRWDAARRGTVVTRAASANDGLAKVGTCWESQSLPKSILSACATDSTMRPSSMRRGPRTPKSIRTVYFLASSRLLTAVCAGSPD